MSLCSDGPSLATQPFRCYFYPGRDCSGWQAGGTCGRVGKRIPPDERDEPERGPW